MNLEALERQAGAAEGLLKAVANRRRLTILCELSRGERSVSDLGEAIGLSQSALSQHLAVLRANDLVKTRRESQSIFYSIKGRETPVILAAGLAAGAIVALALALIASVRRRRRDLALLKTLGFTTRQLAATIAWQASVIAAIAAIVGVPVGIAIGRQFWVLFARNINAVPQPTVPASLILVAAGALIFANLVAAVPARMAARTPAALVLRTE